jgi:uncharacterized repeat protein (TIGR01451 family)
MNVGQFRMVTSRLAKAMLAGFCLLLAARSWAAGTAVGTPIDNTATVDFTLSGTPLTLNSNTSSFLVAERLEVVVTLQSGQILVSANDTDQALLFTVTNTGNGSETIQLAINSIVAGDDFDPSPAVPAIYFDSDGSGDLSAGDTPYSPGVNEPTLAPDTSIDVLIVNDIPGTVVNGEIGRSELIASAATGTGAPGTVFGGQGDGGTNAVVGASGATATVAGEYLVSDVLINVIKAQSVQDPFGGAEPVPGATITYSVTVEVASAGVATASILRDPIPAFTTFVPDSIRLNGLALSDPIDGDAGELDTSIVPTVVVRLGDLNQADGIQTVEFQVTID